MSATEASLIAYACFVVVGLLLYSIFFKKYKWVVLLVLSYIMIFFLSAYWLIFMIIATIIVFGCGIWIGKLNKSFEIKKEGLEKEEKKKLKAQIKKKQKLIMVLGLFLSFLILALLKYTDPLKHIGLELNIAKNLNELFEKYSFAGFNSLKLFFPLLGISYYTLTSTGYLIDVYRKKYDCERNIFKLALFIGFFPLQIEGPISRYDKLSPQLYKDTNPTYEDLSYGGSLIVWGLFKKIVIADRLSIAVTEIFNNYNEYAGPVVFLGAIFYAFQLYCDFSGYIDIARGVSRLFGIKLEDNFDRPFMSKTVSEFWRRWHMSLGAWLRDYVFYSVSFSKPYMALNVKIHNKVKPVFEKFIASLLPMLCVWLVCGIWHGCGIKYIVYGMYYYVVMMIGILLEPVHIYLCNKLHLNREGIFVKTLAIIRTLVIVMFGLMMFRADSLPIYFDMVGQLFKGGTYDLIGLGLINSKDLIIMFISIAFILGIEIIQEFIDIPNKFHNSNIAIRYTLIIGLIVVIILFGAYGEGYGAIDPLYAAF
ncbi:MAG: hypothetical protein K6A63_04530 [Acholeplasmatales bacterium]|nr:hypothetical protein [Acholeplasmatales bacterium]